MPRNVNIASRDSNLLVNKLSISGQMPNEIDQNQGNRTMQAEELIGMTQQEYNTAPRNTYLEKSKSSVEGLIMNAQDHPIYLSPFKAQRNNTLLHRKMIDPKLSLNASRDGGLNSTNFRRLLDSQDLDDSLSNKARVQQHVRQSV